MKWRKLCRSGADEGGGMGLQFEWYSWRKTHAAVQPPVHLIEARGRDVTPPGPVEVPPAAAPRVTSGRTGRTPAQRRPTGAPPRLLAAKRLGALPCNKPGNNPGGFYEVTHFLHGDTALPGLDPTLA